MLEPCKKPKIHLHTTGSNKYVTWGFCPKVESDKNGKFIIPPNVNECEGYVSSGQYACFSTLIEKAQEQPDHKYIYYSLEFNAELSVDTLRRFLELSQENLFLPEYVDIDMVLEKKGIVLELTDILNANWRNILYVYLSTVRLCETDPKIVENLVTLVDHYGMDYCLAIVATTVTGMQNMNHMFLPSSVVRYAPINKLKDIKVPIHIAAGLYAMINFLEHAGAKGKHFTGFTCNKTIDAVYGNKHTVSIAKLFCKEANAVVRSKSEKEYNENLDVLKQLKKEKQVEE